MIKTALTHYILEYSLNKMLDNSIINLTLPPTPKFNIGDKFNYIIFKVYDAGSDTEITVKVINCNIKNLMLTSNSELMYTVSCTGLRFTYASHEYYSRVLSTWKSSSDINVRYKIIELPKFNSFTVLFDVRYIQPFQVVHDYIIDFDKIS